MKVLEKIHPSVFDDTSLQNDIVAWLSEDVSKIILNNSIPDSRLVRNIDSIFARILAGQE